MVILVSFYFFLIFYFINLMSTLCRFMHFERTDCKFVRGRLHREWLDDITDWCDIKLHQLLVQAQTCTTSAPTIRFFSNDPWSITKYI